jgi:hypothetical protein
MGSQIEVSELKPCPASSDRAYIATNTALWLLGAFGMFWMTSNLALNLVMPVAYLVVNFVFFWRIFPRVVCASCAYHHPALSRDEYLVDFRDRFVAALKRWYKVWVLIGWAWQARGPGFAPRFPVHFVRSVFARPPPARLSAVQGQRTRHLPLLPFRACRRIDGHRG